MLPPVAEIYVVWHPGDAAGVHVAEKMVSHFHGTPFTGLIGSAVDVYTRSTGWRGPADAPRPIPLPGTPPPNGLPGAQLVAVVPLLGTELAATIEAGAGPWHDYLVASAASYEAFPDRVRIFPLVLDQAVLQSTELDRLLGRFQGVGPAPADPADPSIASRACRDLAQGITQLASGAAADRLTVFISYARRDATVEQQSPADLVSLVRSAIGRTRLREFFDAHDLQPGQEWSNAIRTNAATSAMVAIRTDRYASRAWCQREMLAAKRAGMPVVILDALGHGDERGSFLMDHVPRVPVRRDSTGWRPEDIDNGLNLLVDECLKRSLWQCQRQLANRRPELEVAWWAPHAPEPATLAAWLTEQRSSGGLHLKRPLRILHPDPPLGPDETEVLRQMVTLGGAETSLEIMTPRSLAARGG